MEPIIKLSNITASYRDQIVIKNANLTIYENDFLGVIGPNGGGKTTLMQIILGLKKPDTGQIKYFRNGQETKNISMGYLPQQNNIDKKFPISVYEVILSGLSREKHLFSSYTKKHHQQVTNTIGMMGLEKIQNKHIGELSGGQLQRVLLARAVVSEPEIVILDEPNTYIDKHHQAHMYDFLNQLNKKCAIVIVSHDIGTILQNVKDVACVNQTLNYHSSTEFEQQELPDHFGCPIELLGHGDIPHRILKKHEEN